jgi:multiple sugar transport system permease protein
MDRYSPVMKTVIAILVSTVLISVLVPLAFFLKVAFSSDVEMYQFPKSVLPTFSVTVKVTPRPANEFELAMKGPDGSFQSIMTTKNPAKIETLFRTQYNVDRTGDELLADWAPLQQSQQERTFTYPKDMLYDFKAFFRVVNNAAPALQNSIVVSLLTILISLSLGSLSGYAIARFEFRGKQALSMAMLIVRMFPTVGLSIPAAVLMIKMGLYDTMLGLAILYSVPNIALTAWITSSIFVGIDHELEEAAMVFGASRRRAFFSVALPLAFPAIAASSMYAFLTAWNDTISALVLTDRNPTLSLIVYKAVGTTSNGIQYAAAGSVILILPALVFTFWVRRYVNQMWGGVTI